MKPFLQLLLPVIPLSLFGTASSVSATDARTIDEVQKGRVEVAPRASSDLADFLVTSAASILRLQSKAKKVAHARDIASDPDPDRITTEAKAMRACADRVEQESAETGRQAHVREIEEVSQTATGWLLTGVIETGHTSDDHFTAPVRFNCLISNGIDQAVSVIRN